MPALTPSSMWASPDAAGPVTSVTTPTLIVLLEPPVVGALGPPELPPADVLDGEESLLLPPPQAVAASATVITATSHPDLRAMNACLLRRPGVRRSEIHH